MYTAAIRPFNQEVTAEEVIYTPEPGYPPGTDNVAEALDFLVNAAPSSDPMQPTVRGTAYGLQDAPGNIRNINALGYAVNTSPGMSNCIDLYTASPFGQTQEMIIGNSLCIDNRNIQNTATTVSNASAVLNENVCSGAVLAVSAVHANQSNFTNANTLNCVFDINDVNCTNIAAQQSAVVGTNSTLQNATLDRSVLVTTRGTMTGLNLEGSTVVGSLDGMNIANGSENVILAAKTAAGPVVNILGRQCGYIGNQARPETVNDREFVISSYDRFFLDTPRSDIGPLVCYFDDITDELTVGAPQPAPVPTTTTFASTMLPVVSDTATSAVTAIDNPAVSLVFRALGTTNGAGQVVFTTPVNPTIPSTVFSATARTASTTVAHTCHIISANATTVTVQVFRSATVVLGGATMIPALAGILVNFAMFYG